MFWFALKNMAIKAAQCILVALSIIISAGIAVLAYNVANKSEWRIFYERGKYC